MTDNFLKLNEDKTELVFIGTRKQLKKCDGSVGNNITITGIDIEYSTSVHNLSFYFDKNLKGSSHVNSAVLLTVLSTVSLKSIISWVPHQPRF